MLPVTLKPFNTSDRKKLALSFLRNSFPILIGCQLGIDDNTLIIDTPASLYDKVVVILGQLTREIESRKVGNMCSVYCDTTWKIDYCGKILQEAWQEEDMETTAVLDRSEQQVSDFNGTTGFAIAPDEAIVSLGRIAAQFNISEDEVAKMLGSNVLSYPEQGVRVTTSSAARAITAQLANQETAKRMESILNPEGSTVTAPSIRTTRTKSNKSADNKGTTDKPKSRSGTSGSGRGPTFQVAEWKASYNYTKMLVESISINGKKIPDLIAVLREGKAPSVNYVKKVAKLYPGDKQATAKDQMSRLIKSDKFWSKHFPDAQGVENN